MNPPGTTPSFLGSLRQSLRSPAPLNSKQIISTLQKSDDLCQVICCELKSAITEITRMEKVMEANNKEAFQKLVGFAMDECDNDNLMVTKVNLTPAQKNEFKVVFQWPVEAWISGKKNVLRNLVPATDNVNLAVCSAFEWIEPKFIAQEAIATNKHEAGILCVIHTFLEKCDQGNLIIIRDGKVIRPKLTEPQNDIFKLLLPSLIRARIQFNKENKADPGNQNIKIALDGMPDNDNLFFVEKIMQDGEEKIGLTYASKNKPNNRKLLLWSGVPNPYDALDAAQEASQSGPPFPSTQASIIPPIQPYRLSQALPEPEGKLVWLGMPDQYDSLNEAQGNSQTGLPPSSTQAPITPPIPPGRPYRLRALPTLKEKSANEQFVPDPNINDDSAFSAIQTENGRIAKWLLGASYDDSKTPSENFVSYLVMVESGALRGYNGKQVLVFRHLELKLPDGGLNTNSQATYMYIPSNICLKNFELSIPIELIYKNGSGTTMTKGAVLHPYSSDATGTAFAPNTRVIASNRATGKAGQGGEAEARTEGSKLHRMDKAAGTKITAHTKGVEISEEGSQRRYISKSKLCLESKDPLPTR